MLLVFWEEGCDTFERARALLQGDQPQQTVTTMTISRNQGIGTILGVLGLGQAVWDCMCRPGLAPAPDLGPPWHLCVHAFELSNLGDTNLCAMIEAILCDMGKPLQCEMMVTYLGHAGIAHGTPARAPRLLCVRAFELSNLGETDLCAMIEAILCDMGEPLQSAMMVTYLCHAGIAHGTPARAPRPPHMHAFELYGMGTTDLCTTIEATLCDMMVLLPCGSVLSYLSVPDTPGPRLTAAGAHDPVPYYPWAAEKATGIAGIPPIVGRAPGWKAGRVETVNYDCGLDAVRCCVCAVLCVRLGAGARARY